MNPKKTAMEKRQIVKTYKKLEKGGRKIMGIMDGDLIHQKANKK